MAIRIQRHANVSKQATLLDGLDVSPLKWRVCGCGLNRFVYEGMNRISNVEVHLKTRSGNVNIWRWYPTTKYCDRWMVCWWSTCIERHEPFKWIFMNLYWQSSSKYCLWSPYAMTSGLSLSIQLPSNLQEVMGEVLANING